MSEQGIRFTVRRYREYALSSLHDTDASTMTGSSKTTSTTIEKVRGRDLPPEWARRAGIKDDELVDVTLRPTREQRVKALQQLMDQVADEARRKGLNDERLDELLRDD